MEDSYMNEIQNKKRMYDYCCAKVICHKEILSRIIQGFVDEAKGMTIEEISKYIYGIQITSLEEYIYSTDIYKRNKQDIRCYFNVKECIEINIYLNLEDREDKKIYKRKKKHKVYHLYFITRSLKYEDGTVLIDTHLNRSIYRIYIPHRYLLKTKYKKYNDILILMHLILDYRRKIRYKIRLVKKYIDNEEIHRGLEIMGNLSKGIEMDVREEKVKKITREITREYNIKAVYNVMKNLNVSVELAMKILDIPRYERNWLEAYFKK